MEARGCRAGALLHVAVFCGFSICLKRAPDPPTPDMPVFEKAAYDRFNSLRIIVVKVAKAMQGADKTRSRVAVGRYSVKHFESRVDQTWRLRGVPKRYFDAIHIPDHVHGSIDLESIRVLAFGIRAAFAADAIKEARVHRQHRRHALDLEVRRHLRGEDAVEISGCYAKEKPYPITDLVIGVPIGDETGRFKSAMR
jgi:hypothetical protein